jgi:hypothetical protein
MMIFVINAHEILWVALFHENVYWQNDVALKKGKSPKMHAKDKLD